MVSVILMCFSLLIEKDLFLVRTKMKGEEE